MKIFKDAMSVANVTFGAALFGNAIGQTFLGNFKTATILLFVVSSLFIVSYFAERFSK